MLPLSGVADDQGATNKYPTHLKSRRYAIRRGFREKWKEETATLIPDPSFVPKFSG
jgi:hypothetical protein